MRCSPPPAIGQRLLLEKQRRLSLRRARKRPRRNPAPSAAQTGPLPSRRSVWVKTCDPGRSRIRRGRKMALRCPLPSVPFSTNKSEKPMLAFTKNWITIACAVLPAAIAVPFPMARPESARSATTAAARFSFPGDTLPERNAIRLRKSRSSTRIPAR
jgi:hypothetical protein